MPCSAKDDGLPQGWPRLAVEVTELAGTSHVRLVGELDLAAAGALRGTLQGEVDRRPRRMVIDLSGVAFLDAAGLRALLDLRERGNRGGTTVVFRSPSRHVARLMEVLGLTDEGLPRAPDQPVPDQPVPDQPVPDE